MKWIAENIVFFLNEIVKKKIWQIMRFGYKKKFRRVGLEAPEETSRLK